MSLSPSTRLRIVAAFLGSLLANAGCSAPTTNATAHNAAAVGEVAPPALEHLDYSGDQQALIDLDRTIGAAGTDATKVSAVVANLVAVLRRADLTLAARQAICERLGQLLTAPADLESALAVLAPMLNDEHQVNLARLALERVPGSAVDTLFLSALRGSLGSTRLALIQSVGNRHIADAVPVLAPLLKEPDATTAAAAAGALGQVGTTAAFAALLGAPDPDSRAVVDARLACAWHLSGADSIAALRGLSTDSHVFVAQRAAAFRGLLDREPATASQRIVDVLAGDDPVFKRVAIEAIFSSPAPGLVSSLAAKMAAWDGPTEAAVITALGRKGDAAAVPAILTALAHADADVRAAAIGSLGRLPGNKEVATRLAQIGTGATADEAKLARQSLARLSGPDVAATIVAGAEHAESQLRAVFLEEIGLRNMTEAMPLLLKTHSDTDQKARSAALSALAEIATPAEEGAILAWAITATDAQEVTRALRALVNVSRQNHDVATRDRAVVEAIDRGAPEVQLRLLPVLSRLASEASLACAGRMALSQNAAVAHSATDTLARWPDDSALPILVATAEQSTVDAARAAAVQGAIRIIERSRGLPKAEPSAIVARLLGTPCEIEVRRNLVLLLGRGANDIALKAAENLQADPALAEAAKAAVLAIRANQEWPPHLKASAGAGQLNNLVDGKPKSVWSVPATADQWVQLDFGRTRPLRRITLDQTGRDGDYPEHYEVFVTDDEATPGPVRASGAGRRAKTVIELPPGTAGRILLIKSTAERKDGNWAIAELQID